MNRAVAKRRRVRLGGLVLWLLGLGAVIALVAHQGLAEVATVTATAGWGILWIALIQLLPMMADTLAWRQLVRPDLSVSLLKLFWVRWIGESVNNLLPVGRVGGEFLRAWLAYRKAGLPGPVAGASVVADLTITVATLVFFTLFGLSLLLSRGAGDGLLQSAAIGAGFLLFLLASFLVLQRAGLIGGLGRMLEGPIQRLGWISITSDVQQVAAELRHIYRRPGSLAASTLSHLVGWVSGALEVWVGLWLLGHPVGFLDAVILESLVQAVRSAAFFVPGALGVQESGLMLLGAVVGLPPEVALALSLIKRIREFLVGVPGLLVWQTSELHRHFQRAVGASGL